LVWPGLPTLPDIDDMLTMDPPVPPFRPEALGHRQAESAGRSGYDRVPPVEQAHVAPAFHVKRVRLNSY
jgi:hypothetical protein